MPILGASPLSINISPVLKHDNFTATSLLRNRNLYWVFHFPWYGWKGWMELWKGADVSRLPHLEFWFHMASVCFMRSSSPWKPKHIRIAPEQFLLPLKWVVWPQVVDPCLWVPAISLKQMLATITFFNTSHSLYTVTPIFCRDVICSLWWEARILSLISLPVVAGCVKCFQTLFFWHFWVMWTVRFSGLLACELQHDFYKCLVCCWKHAGYDHVFSMFRTVSPSQHSYKRLEAGPQHESGAETS